MQDEWKGALLSLMAYGVYATHDVVIKILGERYNSFQILFFAALLSLPIIVMALFADKTQGTLIPRHPWWSLLRALTTVGLGALGFYAFSVLPLAETYAILFAMPLIITVLAIPMLGEKVSIRRGGAVVVGLIGVAIVLRPSSPEAITWGHLAAFGAAFMGAASSVILRKIGREERTSVLILYTLMATIVVSGAVLPLVYKPMPLRDVVYLAIVAIFSVCAAFLVIAAYRRSRAIIVAPMQYSQILWAVFYGSVFFNESLDTWTFMGATIIIASGIYIVLRENKPSVSKNSPVLANHPTRP